MHDFYQGTETAMPAWRSGSASEKASSSQMRLFSDERGFSLEHDLPSQCVVHLVDLFKRWSVNAKRQAQDPVRES